MNSADERRNRSDMEHSKSDLFFMKRDTVCPDRVLLHHRPVTVGGMGGTYAPGHWIEVVGPGAEIIDKAKGDVQEGNKDMTSRSLCG